MADSEPIPIRLNCPECGELHVDEGEFATRPHHTHSCQHCGMVWRPAVVNTVGVRFLPGFGEQPMAVFSGPLSNRNIKLLREYWESLNAPPE